MLINYRAIDLFFRFFLVFFFLFALSACGKGEAPKPPQTPNSVFIHPLQKQVSEWDEYTGRFRAQDSVEVRARVTGYLDKVLFKDGDFVKKGQSLFVIDPRPFQFARDRADAQYELNNKEYLRVKSLRNKNAVSEQDLDQSHQAMRQSKADADDARLNLEFTQIKSPINGIISRRRVDVGNLVTSGDVVLTTIVSENPIDFYFNVSEQDLLKYRALLSKTKAKGDRPVRLRLQDEKDFIHQGTLTFSDNQVDAGSGTLEMRATFDNAEGMFKPGMFATMRLQATDTFEALLVPDALIGSTLTNKFIFVIGPDDVVISKPVELGSLQDGGLRVIRSGLNPKDRVVAENLMMTRPGIKVVPVLRDDKAAPAPSPVKP
jgi:RND family efflux transporter MFP subunit